MHGELSSPFSSENEQEYTVNALKILERFGSGTSGRDPLQQEARREELYELFERAPSPEVLNYLLYKSQYYIDTAFAIEAAEEHRLPKRMWSKFTRALLHRNPDFPEVSFEYDVAACFGKGLLAHPEARYYALRALAHHKSVYAGPLVEYSDLEVVDEQGLLQEWAEEKPLLYANTSKSYLTKRHTPTVVDEWDEVAAVAAKELTQLPLQERLKVGAISLTSEISGHTALREALTEVRASCITDEAKEIERLLLKYAEPLEKGVRRDGEVDYQATEVFKKRVRELFYSRPFPDEVRHLAILLALRRMPAGTDISVSDFIDTGSVRAAPMDRRVMVEFAAVEIPQPHLVGHDFSTIGWLNGSGVSFRDGVVDEEDAAWIKRKMDEFLKDVDPKNYRHSVVFTDAIDICLVSGVPFENEWLKYAGQAYPTELISASFLHDTTNYGPSGRIQRMSATQRAYVAEHILRTIDRKSTLERGSALHWLRSFLANFPMENLSDLDQVSVKRSLKRIVQKILEESSIDEEIMQVFLSDAKAFCIKVSNTITTETLRCLYDASVRLSPELKAVFYKDVDALSLHKEAWVFRAGTLDRWEKLYSSYPEEYAQLRLVPDAFIHALCQPVTKKSLDTLVANLKRWDEFCKNTYKESSRRKAVLADLRGYDPTIGRRLEKLWEEHMRSFEYTWRVAKVCSFFLDVSPEEAGKKADALKSLGIDIERLYDAGADGEKIIQFAYDYEPRFKALLERLSDYSIKKAVLLRVLKADDRVSELSQVERMIDEFEKPGSEAEHLVRLMMDLVTANEYAWLRLKGLSLPASLGGADLASVEKETLEQLMVERIDAILQVPKQAYAEASRRNANAVREADVSGPRLREGTLLHWTEIKALPSMLSQGNMCGESLGVNGGVDSYPFHLDTVAVLDEHADQTFDEAFKDRRLLYVDSGAPVGIVYPYRHQQDAFAHGEEYPIAASDIYGHRLLFGGLPKTEAGYILVNADTESSTELVQEVKEAIVQGEVFLPIYSLKGKLLFDEQEYIDLYLKTKPYGTVAQFLADESWMDQLDVEQNEAHEFTLKRHLLLAESYAVEYAQQFELDPARARLVRVAARLHDVGKLEDGPQALSNVDAAERWLGKVRRVPREEMRAIRRLIHHDELLGDVLQETEIDINGNTQISEEGQRQLERFKTIFPTLEDQKMLLAIYMADVRAIGNGKFREWKIEEKLRALGIADFSG